MNITEIYDPATDSWTRGASMPYPVVGFASATVDNKIYVIGGQDEFNKFLNIAVNQIYDTITNSWTTGQSLPLTTLEAVGVATTGVNAPQRVYVIGGYLPNPIAPSAANQVYDPANDNWTSGTPFPTTHDYVTEDLAAVALNDSLYVIGGIAQANEGFYEITEQYIPTDYNGTIIQPITTAQPNSTPTNTPSNSATASPIQSLTPSPSVSEFQSWIIPIAILIATLPAALLIKKKNRRLLIKSKE